MFSQNQDYSGTVLQPLTSLAAPANPLAQAGLILPHENLSENDKQFASKTRANIARAQWDDWMTRFLPKLQELTGAVNNSEIMAQATARASEYAHQGFDQAQQQLGQQREAYGLQLRGDELESSERSLALGRAATEAGAVNQTRHHIRERDIGLMGGSVGTAGVMQGG